MTQAAAPAKVTFDDHVQPIFREHCLACHDADGRSGDLALDSYNDTLTGGASGEVLAAGDVDGSRLWRLVAHLDKPIMPPGQDKIPADGLEVIRAWIDGGLLENEGSKAKPKQKSAVAGFEPSADNRPSGEPAMPGGFYREPVLQLGKPGAVAELAASPWAPLVVVAAQRQVLLYHTQTHELLGVAPFVVGMPEVIRFSRNGDLLLVAGGQGAKLGVAHLWDIKTGRRIAEIGDELDTILAADISPDHSLVAIGGPRKKVEVFRTADSTLAYEITKHTDWITALEFSPDGQRLATADRAAGGFVWEGSTGRPVGALAGHQGPITAVSWRGDSGVIATASDDATIRLWQPDGKQIKQWGAHGGVLDVKFTKDGRLVTVGRDRNAKLWDGEGKELKNLATMGDLALSIATTFDDRLTIIGDFTGEVRLVEVESGSEVAKLSADPPTLAMRVESAQQAINAANAAIEPAQQSLAAAEQVVGKANDDIAQYQAARQSAEQALAESNQAKNQRASELQTQQAALAAVDDAIAKAKAVADGKSSELAKLQEQFAAVGNQEGENADAATADQLQAAITQTESQLAELQDSLLAVEAKRPAVAEAVTAAEQFTKDAEAQVTDQQQKVAEFEARAIELPKVELLTTEYERLSAELAEKQAAEVEAERKLESLQQELAAHLSRGEQLTQQLTAGAKTTEELQARLSGVQQQLIKEQSSVDTVDRETDALKQRIADLEKVHQQLAAITEKTRGVSDGVQEQINKVSTEKQAIEQSLADLEAVAKLRVEVESAD